MRILQIAQKPQRRGAEVFAFELSQQLRASGHDVRAIYLYDYRGENPLPLAPGDVCLGAPADAATERVPGVQPRLLRRLARETRSFAPDIVQVNGARSVKYGAALKLLEGSRCAWKLVYRNIDMPRYWNRGTLGVSAYRTLIMPHMDGAVGVSEASLAQVMELYQLRVPAVTIRNGIDTSKLSQTVSRGEVRSRLGIRTDDFVVLFAGSLVAQKRPDRFVRVVRELRSRVPRVRAWMVGDGPLRAGVAAQVAAELPAGCCALLGYQDGVGDYLVAADALVVTSDTEGIPAVVLEAGYVGLPVVATRVGALHECVEHGVTGYLAQSPFEENLTSALVTLASEAGTRRAMGRAARARVELEFTMRTVARRYDEFYTRLIG